MGLLFTAGARRRPQQVERTESHNPIDGIPEKEEREGARLRAGGRERTWKKEIFHHRGKLVVELRRICRLALICSLGSKWEAQTLLYVNLMD